MLDDLGYRASDILQSNSIIWVEGPSDRIYLNHWIKSFDSSLKEGVHYCIMFYGGGLIKHLSASEAALDGFVELRKMNRNMAILFDSDRDSNTSALKPSVQRILDEARLNDVLIWVTAGREVENYISGEVLQDALKKCHPRIYLSSGKTGLYDHSFYFFRQNPKNPSQKVTYKDGDKVGAASIVCQLDADLDVLDLRQRVDEVVRMIRKANGLQAL